MPDNEGLGKVAGGREVASTTVADRLDVEITATPDAVNATPGARPPAPR